VLDGSVKGGVKFLHGNIIPFVSGAGLKT